MTFPLLQKKERNFSVGNDILPKRDLTRFVRWPKRVRIARQKKILQERLKVPPAIAQFKRVLPKNNGIILLPCVFIFSSFHNMPFTHAPHYSPSPNISSQPSNCSLCSTSTALRLLCKRSSVSPSWPKPRPRVSPWTPSSAPSPSSLESTTSPPSSSLTVPSWSLSPTMLIPLRFVPYPFPFSTPTN